MLKKLVTSTIILFLSQVGLLAMEQQKSPAQQAPENNQEYGSDKVTAHQSDNEDLGSQPQNEQSQSQTVAYQAQGQQAYSQPIAYQQPQKQLRYNAQVVAYQQVAPVKKSRNILCFVGGFIMGVIFTIVTIVIIIAGMCSYTSSHGANNPQ